MSGDRYTIMVVDDDPRNHKIMQYLLEEEYDVHCVGSGQECLDNIQALAPDVLLLDIMMPKMDGYEVCRRLRTDDAWFDLPIIFVSAKNSISERLLGYEAGATEYFVKPFEHDEFLGCIKRILEYKRQPTGDASDILEAQKIALQALTNASDLGVILQFAQASYSAASFEALAHAVFEATNCFGLLCSLTIRAGDDTLFMTSSGTVSPIEQSVLELARDKGRIFDFSNKSLYNFEHISLVVKNMPVNDEIKYGMIKDNICHLLEAAEARIRGLINKRELDLQTKKLEKIVEDSFHMMQKLNRDMHGMRMEGATIVEDMKEAIETLVHRMHLTITDETDLLAITDGGLAKTIELFNKGIQLDGAFYELVKQLHNGMNERARLPNQAKD